MGERERDRGGGNERADAGGGHDARQASPGKRSTTEELGEPGSGPPPLSPGKRALTDGMGSIQMKRTPGGAVSTATIHDAAARGLSTAASALPFADQVQASFGPEHDVSKIQAHVGSDAPQTMGAEAFASGNHVVFGRQPDLHTVAHEAAHVVQQANGVNLYGGVGEAGDAHEQHADAVADRVVAGRSAADLFGTATRSATPQLHAVQMKPAAITPAKQSDFVIPLPQDSFTVSFELLSAGASDVRVVIAPADFSRAYQSELKYWDVKGREVDKDDSYVSMGNWSVPAQPNQQTTQIATPAKFDPIDLNRLPEPTATVWTFDLDGDGKPDFAVRIDFKIGNIFREYSVTTTNNQSKVEKFGFHFVQDDAYKHGYQGNSAPRREKDDFVDALKAPLEMAVLSIPVIGEIVLAVEAITGRSLFGEKLSTTERVIAGVAALLPVAGGLIAKGIGRAGADLAKLASKLGRSEEEVMALLRAIDKESAEAGKLKQWEATAKAGGKLGASEVAELQRIVRQIEADERVFRAADQEATRATHDVAKATELEKEGEELLSLCFPAGTLVQSPTGAITIERVMPGTAVYSWDTERHMAETRRIIDVRQYRAFRLISIRVAGAVVEATPRHPFFRVDDARWVPAAALEPGASVMGLHGKPLRIEAVTDRTLDAPTEVYSLSVEANPTYFVGEAAVWVHNAPPSTAPSLPEKVIYDDGMVRVWHNFGNTERATGTMVEHAPIHFHARLANNARIEYQLFPSGVKLRNSAAPPEAIVDVFRANRSRFDRVAKRIGKWYRHWTKQCS